MTSSDSAGSRLENVPHHVGIIMDGNGRWAEVRGLPRLEGHRSGTENIRRILEASVEWGVGILTLYAFSTENWARPASEVEGLLAILEGVIDREVENLDRDGVQLRHVGRLNGVGSGMARKVREAIRRTRHNDRLILNVAFNYGGRAEILDAVRRLIQDGVPPEEVTEERFEEYLDTAGLPPPDLIIRTGGEMRLSNFLIWQAAYAEYYATETFWPDFGKEEFYQGLLAYSSRERRFGRLREQARTR